MLINQACGTQATQPKNIGGKKQCREGNLKTSMFSKDDFFFPTIADAQKFAEHFLAVKNRKVYPLPLIESVEDASTQDEIEQGTHEKEVTKAGTAGTAYTIKSAICTHDALKTYENFTREFQFTDKNEMLCEIDEQGRVWGRKVNFINIGLRGQLDKSTKITIDYSSDVYSVLKLDYDVQKLDGIRDVEIEIISASTSEIIFKVREECSEKLVNGIEGANVVVKDGETAQGTSFTDTGENGIYVLNADTTFASGYTIDLVGVVDIFNKAYATNKAKVITVS